MGKSLVKKKLDRQPGLHKISLLAFTFCAFLLSFNVNAQVIIKEKVEINPQTIVISDDPVNSYYCNHIYYPYYYQQTFGEMQCLRAFCDTSVVWYGEDFYNFCFLPTVTKSINVVEGSEYVQIYLGYVPSTSETGSCFDCTEYFVTTDNLFLQPDGECTYIKFNETKPTDTAFVKIIVTDYSDEVYTFNVFVVNPVFTLFDYTYDHNLKRNNEIILDVCASPQFGYSLNLPDTTKYNVEIIMGYDFGNLVNNTTSDSGQVLNDLPHNYGCLGQIILRTNDQIQADSEIKIRVSTSDPSIEPIEMTFTNLLVVNIVPETISPGDTAQIIPKLKNPDGSLSDFPIEQTFEIGMLDGCALGMIKTATDSGLYVDAALRPFYFIADTGAVEGTVKLRVGVIEGMSSSSLLNNNFKSRKSEYQVKKSSTSDNHREAQSFIDGGVIGEYCFLGDLYSVVTGDANVVVEDGCDYPPYDPSLYALNYELIRHDNYYPWVFDDDAQLPITTLIDVCDFPDVNQSGGSKPVFYSRIRKNQFGSYVNSWDIQPLIDGEDKLHFSIIDPTTKVNTSLKFDFVTGVCYYKINPPGQEPKVLIYNLDDISNSQIIPNRDQALQAMEDFCGHHCYPQEIFKYKLIDIINLHEGEHMNDYRDLCLIPKFQNLEDNIKNVTLGCNSYNEESKKNQIALIKYLVKEFIRDAISHFDQVNILATKNDYTYEKKLQRRPSIVNRITDYTDRLKSEFNISVPANCKTCR